MDGVSWASAIAVSMGPIEDLCLVPSQSLQCESQIWREWFEIEGL